MRVLFLLFILVPVLEMWLLIRVGGVIGALPTILLVCLTAAMGIALIRAQGAAVLQRAQKQVTTGQLPARELLDGVCLLLGGALLLTPGFATDSLGFVLLIPVLRAWLFHRLVQRLLRNGSFAADFGGNRFYHAGRERGQSREKGVIEGEFQRDSDQK